VGKKNCGRIISGTVRSVESLPENPIGMRSLLIEIFGNDNELEAQEFYARITVMGWKGSRRITVRWLDKCSSHGIILFRPARTGSGRIFVLAGREENCS